MKDLINGYKDKITVAVSLGSLIMVALIVLNAHRTFAIVEERQRVCSEIIIELRNDIRENAIFHAAINTALADRFTGTQWSLEKKEIQANWIYLENRIDSTEVQIGKIWTKLGEK